MTHTENIWAGFTERDAMKSVMDVIVKIVHYRCANAMNHPQYLELLKEIENNGFNEFNGLC